MNKPIDCVHCDEDGFCRFYSDFDVAWKCPGDGDCERYVEEPTATPGTTLGT